MQEFVVSDPHRMPPDGIGCGFPPEGAPDSITRNQSVTVNPGLASP